MKGTKNYFLLSLVMGFAIIVFSLNLRLEVFRSAMYFGLVSGGMITFLSLIEIYNVYVAGKCPICGENLELGKRVCENCGYIVSRRKKRKF